MAALEFAKLHAHAIKDLAEEADERTARAIQRALSERGASAGAILLSRQHRGPSSPRLPASRHRTGHSLPLFSDGPGVADPAQPAPERGAGERAAAAPSADGTGRGAGIVRSPHIGSNAALRAERAAEPSAEHPADPVSGLLSLHLFRHVDRQRSDGNTSRFEGPPRRPEALAEAEPRGRPNQPPSPNESEMDRVVVRFPW